MNEAFSETAQPEQAVTSKRNRSVLILSVLVAVLLITGLMGYALWSSRQNLLSRRAILDAVLAGNYEQAERLITSFNVQHPNDPAIHYFRGLLNVRRDRPAEAIESIRKALEGGYDQDSLLTLRAILLSRADQYGESEPVLRKAFDTEAEPRIEVAEGLARIYLRTFQPARLKPVLERWMALAPEEPRPYLWRAEVNQRVAQEVDPLISDYREALRRAPHLDDTRLALADRLREASKIDEAAAEFETLVARNPRNASALIGLAKVAMLKGEVPSAVDNLEKAIEADPKSSVALRELALIDLRYNRFEQACDRLKRAVAIEPSDPEVRFSYVRALSAAGKTAESAIEAAITERLRKEQKEISDLREKLAERPNDLDLRSQVARYLIEHGHAQEGLEWTALILRSNPKHGPTCRLLAEYHSKNGNPALANYYKLLAPTKP